MNGVEVTQKIFRTIPHCSSKPSVFHRWVFYFSIMAKEIKKNKIKSINHNGNSWHGITICCKSCGVEFEETSNGYYEPMKYEEDRFNRKCNICRNL